MVSDLPNSESVAQYTLIKVLPPVTPNVIIQVNIISYGHSILVTAIDKAVFFVIIIGKESLKILWLPGCWSIHNDL